MNYQYTILYVENVEESLNFYVNAFGFKIKMLTPEKDYGELDTGNTTLAFAIHSLAKSNLTKGYTESSLSNPPFGFELAFISNQIKKDFEQAIEHGALLMEPIKAKPWGQKVGYLKDPNGFLIEMGSEMEG